MRLNEPRIKALTEEEWDDDAKALLKPFIDRGWVLNIFRTLANHPDLARRWMVFANHILGKSTLAIRERELVILRIGYLCQSGYEWGQHVKIGLDCGLTQEEIDRIPRGASADGWNDLDRASLDATGDLLQPGVIDGDASTICADGV